MDRTSVDALTARSSAWLVAHPRLRRTGGATRVAGLAALLGLFAFGVLMLATMVDWRAVAPASVLLALFPVGLHAAAGDRRWARVAGVLPFVVVVPLLSLLGFDVLWAASPLPRPPVALGLLIAAVVLTANATAYVRWLGAPAPARASAWAAGAACGGLAAYVLTGWRAPTTGLVLVAALTGLGVWIYLRRRVGPDPRHPLLWGLWVATAWVLVAPLVIGLLLDRHLSVVLLAAGVAVTIAAVAGRDALARPPVRRPWLFAGTMLATTVAVPAAALGVALLWIAPPADPPTRQLRPAAATAAVPAIALEHRPVLLFDGDEELRTPLDVDRLLATQHVQLCPRGTGPLPTCTTLRGAGDLRNGVGDLRFDTGELEGEDAGTTIYVHVARRASEPGVAYLDYWWYLLDNPADTARGAMCGAGLVIPEITCFDHQSDWEGVTVAVRDPGGEPIAVHYAAHDRVVSVPWPVLQAAWASKRVRRWADGRDVARHPLVFVARGTHAAYPLPCTNDPCATGTVKPDNRHDGAHVWPEDGCAGGCVTPFPVAAGDADASWNDFDGRWGTAVCVLDELCVRGQAPRSPGRQRRFERPWCVTHAVARDIARPRPAGHVPGC